jgi:hypothetical protein
MVRAMLKLLTLTVVLLAGCKGASDDPGAASGAASIPECDQYFRTAQACFSKNPVAKTTLSQSVDEVREMLAPKGGQPLERAKVTGICKQRMEAMEQSCRE